MAEKFTDGGGRKGAEDGAQVYPDPGKKGLPVWLLPLLALLLLGLLLYAFLHRHHGGQEAQTTPAQTVAPAPVMPAATPADNTKPSTPVAAVPDGKDIKVHSGTDVTTAKPGQASVPGVPLSNVEFTAATDPASLIGRNAKLTDVMVRKVLTDRAFFVGTSDTQQMLVLLDKGMDAAAGAGKVPIVAGKPVSLTGIVEALPTQEAVNQQYGVTGDNYTAIQSQKAYLHATVAQKK